METPEYQRQRDARVIRNREVLRDLGLYTSPEPAPKRAPARKCVRQPKKPTRAVPSRNCISKHTLLSEAALAPVFLSEREPEKVLASRFKLSMGKRKSLAIVHWADCFSPSEESEADATVLYHTFLPHVMKEEKAQQAACWLANNDLARGDIVSATEDQSIQLLDELLEYMKPNSGMRLRLTKAWVGMRSGASKSSTRAHTAAQTEVLRLSREFVDNRIVSEGSDSIESFAEMYEKEFADKLAEIAQNVSSKDGFEKYFTRAANGFEASKAMKRVLEERLKYRLKTAPGQENRAPSRAAAPAQPAAAASDAAEASQAVGSSQIEILGAEGWVPLQGAAGQQAMAPDGPSEAGDSATPDDTEGAARVVPLRPKLRLWESETGPHFTYLERRLKREQIVALAVSASTRSSGIPLVIAKAVVTKDHELSTDYQRIAVRLLSVSDDAIKALSAADGLQWSAWKAEDAGAPASVEILQASKGKVISWPVKGIFPSSIFNEIAPIGARGRAAGRRVARA